MVLVLLDLVVGKSSAVNIAPMLDCLKSPNLAAALWMKQNVAVAHVGTARFICSWSYSTTCYSWYC